MALYSGWILWIKQLAASYLIGQRSRKDFHIAFTNRTNPTSAATMGQQLLSASVLLTAPVTQEGNRFYYFTRLQSHLWDSAVCCTNAYFSKYLNASWNCIIMGFTQWRCSKWSSIWNEILPLSSHTRSDNNKHTSVTVMSRKSGFMIYLAWVAASLNNSHEQ